MHESNTANNGLRGDAGVAKAMGMSKVTPWRVRKGHAEPGQKFIKRALKVFPEAKFDDLFTEVA